jgi:hypothetical protein
MASLSSGAKFTTNSQLEGSATVHNMSCTIIIAREVYVPGGIMCEKSMTVAALDAVRDELPLTGVCAEERTMGGLQSTVLLSRFGRVASTLSSH